MMAAICDDKRRASTGSRSGGGVAHSISRKSCGWSGGWGCRMTNIPAGGDFGLNDTPEFLAMNPHGRVPVIDDDGIVVWESQTILRYLAAKYGRGSFWSDDPGERRLAERWMA